MGLTHRPLSKMVGGGVGAGFGDTGGAETPGWTDRQ